MNCELLRKLRGGFLDTLWGWVRLDAQGPTWSHDPSLPIPTSPWGHDMLFGQTSQEARRAHIAEMLSGRSHDYDRVSIYQEYAKTKPSLLDRLLSGTLLGMSLRPDITANQFADINDNAEFAVYDAWVDVGHALSVSARKFGETQRLNRIAN